MKILILALVFVFIDFQILALTRREILSHIKICNEESGVSKDVVIDALEEIIDDDPALKKDLACFFRRVEVFQGPDDDINIEKLKEYFKVSFPEKSDEEREELAKECGKKKSTPEETAFELYKCEVEHMPS